MTTALHRGREGRRWAVAACGVAAGVMALASQAWACTDIMGRMTLDPTSGPPGQAVSVHAVGLKGRPARYKMLFNDANRVSVSANCMDSPTVIKSRVRTDTTGAWTGTVRVPYSAPQGVSQICGKETYPVPGQTGTTHETFTVL